MFLVDLYRYRSRNREHREDYLSTCLAELMRRDQAACRAVLRAAGLAAPKRLTPRVVHTQVRYAGERVDRPDVRLVAGSGAETYRVLFECKVEAVPDRNQIGRYAALEPHVALIAPEDAIASLDPTVWAGVHRVSWQRIGQELDAESARVDDADVPPIRREFVALLEHFGQRGLIDVSPSDIRGAVAAHRRAGDLRVLIRDAVRQLLPDGITYAEPGGPDAGGDRVAAWIEDGLEVCWESGTAPLASVPLEGLGIGAHVGVGAGDPVLEWALWTYPTSKERRARQKLIQDGGWEQGEYDWWRMAIDDPGDPEAPLREQLERVVALSRDWLRTDFGVVTRKDPIALPPGLGAAPMPVAVRDLRIIGSTDAALRAWSVHLLGALQGSFAATGLESSWGRGRKKLVVGSGRDRFHVGTWFWVAPEGAHLGTWVWFDDSAKANAAIARRLADRPWPRGTSAVVNQPSGNFNLHLRVDEHPVGELVSAAVSAVSAALSGMRRTVLSGA